MRCAPDYLHRAGYRLPTRAEWEYACRAGAATSRYYGERAELLGRYAWYTKNSQDKGMLPVGSLKPNDLGLFDMYGNAFEWCQDADTDYPIGKADQATLDVEDVANAQLMDIIHRTLGGGTFSYPAEVMRSANRYMCPPIAHDRETGLRPARTFR
jgi:formylglycine-generating enzyme required for sulfatase activity